MLRRRVVRLQRELRLHWVDGILRTGLNGVTFISSMEASINQGIEKSKPVLLDYSGMFAVIERVFTWWTSASSFIRYAVE